MHTDVHTYIHTYIYAYIFMHSLLTCMRFTKWKISDADTVLPKIYWIDSCSKAQWLTAFKNFMKIHP